MTRSITSATKIRIMELLEASPAGATDHEMQLVLGMDASTQRPRRRELQMAGHIRDSGKKRLSPGGDPCTVWELGTGEKPVKAISKRKALEPFIVKAIYLTNTYTTASDDTPVNVIVTMGAVRALARAVEPPK